MERRKYPRIKTEIDVDFEVVKYDKKMEPPRHIMKGIAKNISARGILLLETKNIGKKILDKLKLGKLRINLTFNIPKSDDQILAQGRLAWFESKEDSTNIGINFIDISQEDFEKLKEYINKKRGIFNKIFYN